MWLQATSKEEQYKTKVLELQNIKNEQERKLKDWNRVSEKMCNELTEAKNKLQSTRYSNMKIKEELAMWKKYSEKVEEERKAVVREKDLQNQIKNKLNHFDSFVKSEREHHNQVLTAMNKFGTDFLNKFEDRLNRLKPQKMKMISVSTQSEPIKDEENIGQNLPDDLTRLKDREIQLEDELKRSDVEVEFLRQQNATLREVIKSMKKDREELEKQRDQIEEEAKVSKLEEKMRLLKNNLVSDEKDNCFWAALQEVKSQVSTLKMKNLKPKADLKASSDENFIQISEFKNTSSTLPRAFKKRN